MYTGLLHTHHWIRYVALILLLVTALKALMDLNKKGVNVGSRKLALYTLISVHIQLLTGLILFFISPKVKMAMENMGAAMKDPASRLVLIEHPLVMLIGITLITIGYVKSKKKTDQASFSKTILIYYGIALVLILSRIPMYSWTF
jgi:hypothetical protein